MPRIMTLAIFLGLAGLAQAAEPVANVGTAVDKGLEFLADEGVNWKEERKCASCHHAPMTLWSLNEAQKAGYTIDQKAGDELLAWILAAEDPSKIFPPPSQPPVSPPAPPLPEELNAASKTEVSVNQSPLMLALGITAGGIKDETARKGLTKMLTTVIEQQRPDGSWGLMYVWEPLGSTPDVITSLVVLSLSTPFAAELGEPVKAARNKGLAWLANAKPEAGLQSAVIKLLLLHRLGKPEAEWQPILKDILARQNSDGGWSATREFPSDAYATGQVLYVLAEVGHRLDDAAITRAQAFLMQTQDKNGSWIMASRVGGPGGKSAKNSGIISYAGTAWAVMGLARTAPKTRTTTAPAAN